MLKTWNRKIRNRRSFNKPALCVSFHWCCYFVERVNRISSFYFLCNSLSGNITSPLRPLMKMLALQRVNSYMQDNSPLFVLLPEHGGSSKILTRRERSKSVDDTTLLDRVHQKPDEIDEIRVKMSSELDGSQFKSQYQRSSVVP